MKPIFPLVYLLAGFAASLAAQSRDDAAGAGAALSCLACSGMLLLAPIAVFVLNIILLIWVAKDAKARGMDNSVVWMILVMLTSFIGLILYIYSRPKGELVECQNCQNKRLQVSAKCPHCGAA
jgi:Mn2+/Fe2+ NRAMP family transporter